ncbi:MAG: D-alanine--D-alanine ligase family protein [Longimicrobiales bacterium]
MRVGLLYDDISSRPDASQDELSILESLDAVDDAVCALGHTPVWIPVPARLDHWIELLAQSSLDVVFNLFEGVGGDSVNEVRVAGIVELLGLPMTGCTAETLGLARRKDRINALLRDAGLPVPDWSCVQVSHRKLYWDRFPAIVKPAAEDASIGITQKSVARNRRELARAIDAAERFDRVVVQHFIEGREFNVGMVGNVLLPVNEIDFSRMPAGAWPMLSYAAKWEIGSPEDVGSEPHCPAAIPDDKRDLLHDLAFQAWRVAEGRGYGRVDFRMNDAGQVFILEVNPNPDIAPGAGLARMARAHGWDYAGLIQHILAEGLK